VVVPCRNEAETIGRCLQSLRAQVPPVDRIVVVDNGSTDDTARIARDLADEVLEVPQGTVGALRNRGAERLGPVEHVGFVDADCEVSPGWAAAALAGLEHADLVGSRTLAPPDAGWVAARWAGIERRQTREEALPWSQHLVLRRETWARLGGFDEQMTSGEDADLALRLRALGGRPALCDAMVVVHHGFPSTLRAFLRRELWHTAAPGWFARMSPRSRQLVVATTGWLAAGLGTGATAGAGRRRPLATWATLSLLGVPLLGRTVGGSSRHAAQDGVLTVVWGLVRAGRLLGLVRGPQARS
jgi:glycosyltransferase involved in cell wall biosynthesis